MPWDFAFFGRIVGLTAQKRHLSSIAVMIFGPAGTAIDDTSWCTGDPGNCFGRNCDPADHLALRYSSSGSPCATDRGDVGGYICEQGESSQCAQTGSARRRNVSAVTLPFTLRVSVRVTATFPGFYSSRSQHQHCHQHHVASVEHGKKYRCVHTGLWR